MGDRCLSSFISAVVKQSYRLKVAEHRFLSTYASFVITFKLFIPECPELARYKFKVVNGLNPGVSVVCLV